MQIFKCLKKTGGKPKTRGNFRTRAALEKYVINRGRECMPISEICSQSGASRTAVDRILQDNKIVRDEQIKRSVEMQKVDRITIKHLKEEMVKRDVQIASQLAELSRLSAIIKLHKDWPLEESRIEAIGQNGNNGEHYE